MISHKYSQLYLINPQYFSLNALKVILIQTITAGFFIIFLYFYWLDIRKLTLS